MEDWWRRKEHSEESDSNNRYFLQLWKLRHPRSQCQKIVCLVRVHFLVIEGCLLLIFSPSREGKRGRRGRERSGKGENGREMGQEGEREKGKEREMERGRRRKRRE